VSVNPILEIFEAIEEDNETTEVRSNEKEATQNVDENDEVFDEGIEEQLESTTPTEALDRSEVENKNVALSYETQMLKKVELTQISKENRESISLAFDSTITQNTQLLREDSQENESKVENKVIEEVADEKVQDTLQAQLDHVENNDEVKESEALAIDVDEHAQIDEIITEPVPKETEPPSNVTTPGNFEPETPRSRKNRINYAALASGSKATPKCLTLLKTQTPARSVRELKLQPQETEVQAPIEEKVVRAEIEASLETIIVSEVVEERIEELPTAKVKDQDPMLEADGKLQKESVADIQVE
jgi:hypothetical protein